jgi:hypothetical protein
MRAPSALAQRGKQNNEVVRYGPPWRPHFSTALALCPAALMFVGYCLPASSLDLYTSLCVSHIPRPPNCSARSPRCAFSCILVAYRARSYD